MAAHSRPSFSSRRSYTTVRMYVKINVDFQKKKVHGSHHRPLPIAHGVYASENVDNTERPLVYVTTDATDTVASRPGPLPNSPSRRVCVDRPRSDLFEPSDSALHVGFRRLISSVAAAMSRGTRPQRRSAAAESRRELAARERRPCLTV